MENSKFLTKMIRSINLQKQNGLDVCEIRKLKKKRIEFSLYLELTRQLQARGALRQPHILISLETSLLSSFLLYFFH